MTSRETTVPFVDLGLQHSRVAAEISAAIDEVISTTAFILGTHVERFESEFAMYCRHRARRGSGQRYRRHRIGIAGDRHGAR